MIWEVAKATGWKLHYILWKINYQTLVMMSADAVRYVDGKKSSGIKQGGKTNLADIFQTKLNERKKKD